MALTVGAAIVRISEATGSVLRGTAIWWGGRQRRRALASLDKMDNWQLDDIGLTRADVDRAMTSAGGNGPVGAILANARQERARQTLGVRQDNQPVVIRYHPAKALYSLWF